VKLFFDTSVLVAASVRSHEHHVGAKSAVERVTSGEDDGFLGAHSLAEVYAVLTRLPVAPRIQSGEAAKIVEENLAKTMKVQALGSSDYLNAIRNAASRGISGGAIYDLLLLAAAEKTAAERIYTFNVHEFRKLAPQIADRIMAP
jgi:predicted nucleic acid-binding protein